MKDYKEIQRYRPNLLFIDLDKNNNNFKSETAFKLALTNTLKKIKDKLDSHAFPTVLWSGNGYHIIQPVYCPTTLENFPVKLRKIYEINYKILLKLSTEHNFY